MLFVAFSAALLPAQTLYWDLNGNTLGAGGTSPSETWSTGGSDKNWSTSSTGTSGGNQKWTNDRYAVFSAGTDANGTFTVSVPGTVRTAGITIEEGTPTFTGGTINFSDASPDFVVNSGLIATVNSVISG
ncbi:MAG: hypothetical protein PSV13_11935, partial [Lacunisphaera sp.]|nr:hypothetical protein [Lacunisphaera sp.]